MTSPLRRKLRITLRNRTTKTIVDAISHSSVGLALVAIVVAGLPATGAAQMPGQTSRTMAGGPVFSPPVHLAPGSAGSSALPQRASQIDRTVPRGSGVRTAAGAIASVNNPFAQLEQDLELPQPPVERISQTPADPAKRKPPARTDIQAGASRSIVGESDRGIQAPYSLVESNGDSIVPHADDYLPGEILELPNLESGVPSRADDGNGGPSRLRSVSSPANSNRYYQEEVLLGQDNNDRPERRKTEMDCGEFRNKLLGYPIQNVALDISPPRNPQGDGPRQFYREWTDIHGNPIVSGKMVDMKRGYVIIDTDSGLQKISFARLGENDLAAIAEAWQIPSHCVPSIDYYQPRCWTPQTVTWYASNLCHKPLYFEDIQLERYGHSDGPFLQPLRSTSHFLVSLVTLPYQTGINPPNECQYALGYYRPGNCAPWLVYPVPISGKGLAHQAAVMVPGAFVLF